VVLRFPCDQNCDEFVAKEMESRDFHRGKVSPPRDEQGVREYSDNCDSATDRRKLVFEDAKNEIAGAVKISQIFLKGFCSAYLAYYLFENFTGRDLMTHEIRAILQ